jgi:hypothetical protein
MDLQAKIERMVELMNIPACEQLLTLEMERLERLMERDIHLYRSLKHGFRHKARGSLQVADQGIGAGGEMFRVELRREGGDDWRVSVLEPPAPEGTPMEELVPLEVVRMMSSFRTDTGKVRRYTWGFNSMEGVCTYCVEFTNFSDHHIIGTIRRIGPVEEEEPEVWGRGEITVIDAADPEGAGKGDEARYNELIYYMEKYRHVKDHVFSDFYLRVKPKLDKRAKERAI